MAHERKRLELWTFMQDRGHPLAQFGSAEYGLSSQDAIEFVGLIEGSGLSVLGIEKWVESNDGYSLANRDGWVSDTDANSESNNVNAMAYLREGLDEPLALYTIQF